MSRNFMEICEDSDLGAQMYLLPKSLSVWNPAIIWDK